MRPQLQHKGEMLSCSGRLSPTRTFTTLCPCFLQTDSTRSSVACPLPDEVCNVPAGLQGQWSLHLHSLLCYNGDFILKRRNSRSFQ